MVQPCLGKVPIEMAVNQDVDEENIKLGNSSTSAKEDVDSGVDNNPAQTNKEPAEIDRTSNAANNPTASLANDTILGGGDAPDVSGLAISDPAGEDAAMHALHSKWALWHMNGALVKRDYDKALTHVYDVQTVEEFWRLIRHIKEPSELQLESAYSLFHAGIKPAWEDAKCKGGVRYAFQLPPAGRARELKPKLINEIWRNMMMHMIGEQFGDDTDLICGAMITLKRGDTWRFEYWLSTTDRDSEVRRIGRQMKEILFAVFNGSKDSVAQLGVRGMPPATLDDLQLEFLNFQNDKLNIKF